MIKKLKKLFISNWILITICAILFLIPLFWFKPGYIDIGGDSTRLYFYNPLQFIKSYSLNAFWPDSLGIKSSGVYSLPFVLFLGFFKFFIRSPYLLIGLFNGLNLTTGFLSIYGIVYCFLVSKKNKSYKVKLSAIMSGLFYTFIPISSMSGWDLPLIIQTEHFVYPLIFFLIMLYFISSKVYYLLLALIVSFIFAQNFSWVGLPNMISFFSFTIIFLVLYSLIFLKQKPNLKEIITVLIFFLLIHAFHYLPLIYSLLEKNTALTNQLSQGNLSDTLHYVNSVASYTEKSYQLFGFTPFSMLSFINISLIIFPIIIILSLIKNKSKPFLFVSFFFAVSYFFVTGKVTNLGFSVYKALFYIPGFIMFRDFFGRWLEIFLVFYSLMIGFSMENILKLKSKFLKYSIYFVLIIILVINAWPFIIGSISNRILTQDTGKIVRSSLKVDPKFIDSLNYLNASFPSSERNMSIPLADFSYQIIEGDNNDGAYFGPSMIAYLSDKSDLSSNFPLRPFALGLFESIKSKNYLAASNLFPLLSINSIFYDSDPYVYEVFSTFPYNDAKLYLPGSQKGLAELIKELPLKDKKSFGKYYHIYEVNKNLQLPIIYAADKLEYINAVSSPSATPDEILFKDATFVLNNFRKNYNDHDIRRVFLNERIPYSDLTTPQVVFSKINSSKYIVTVKNAKGPFILVFSELYNPSWKLYLASKEDEKKEQGENLKATYFNGDIRENSSQSSLLDLNVFDVFGKSAISDNKHFQANAYANAWYILPSDVRRKENYSLILETDDDKITYISLAISLFGIFIVLVWLLRELIKSILKTNEKK